MKRSEMIQIMKNAYSDRRKYQMLYFDDQDAERVLAIMELAGILPPALPEKRVPHTGSGTLIISAFASGHSWEAEDEIS